MKSGNVDEAILDAATQINHASLVAFEKNTVAVFDIADALERILHIRAGTKFAFDFNLFNFNFTVINQILLMLNQVNDLRITIFTSGNLIVQKSELS